MLLDQTFIIDIVGKISMHLNSFYHSTTFTLYSYCEQLIGRGYMCSAHYVVNLIEVVTVIYEKWYPIFKYPSKYRYSCG